MIKFAVSVVSGEGFSRKEAEWKHREQGKSKIVANQPLLLLLLPPQNDGARIGAAAAAAGAVAVETSTREETAAVEVACSEWRSLLLRAIIEKKRETKQ